VFDLFTHPDNREGEAFHWQRCGHESRANYNAVENVGLRYLRRSQTGGKRRHTLGRALGQRDAERER
jgi:hypothetical protein